MSDKPYDKVVRSFVFLLLLLLVSPLILSLGFRALRVFTEMPKILIAYSLLGISCILILYTVYFGFKCFKQLLNMLFDN